MQYKQTAALKKILELKKRLKVIQGGSSAGKTIAILLILIDKAQNEQGKLFSVVSETVPHLKRGAIRDFLSIMESHKYFNENNWNRTDYIYTFHGGSKIEFFSADNPSKVRGPRRDVLFINECNNVKYETYIQLAIRTNEDIYLDYNPVSQFWVHDEIVPTHEHDFLILTYLDNETLPETIVKEIEQRKDRKNFWTVYGMGKLGEAEGKIYSDWEIIDEIPHRARLERYGLDFGYTNDPTALVAVYYYDNGYILDEIAFRRGMSNKIIADTILSQEYPALVIADSSEPKSIDEIKSHGVNITGVSKKRGETKDQTFVKWSIDLVQDQRISVTKRSLNIIKEYRNYLWQTDRDGNILNNPEHEFSHSLDAIRYALVSIIKQPIVYDFKQTQSAVLPYYPELGI